MPDHVHVIIFIDHWQDSNTSLEVSLYAEPFLGRPYGPASGSLGAIIGSYKSATSREINQLRGTPGALVWQRNYYERIIRDQNALRKIRRYIRENPQRWTGDAARATHASPQQASPHRHHPTK